MLKLKKVDKIYQTKSKINVVALDHIDLEFESKGLVFILGASGCGKTTLLNLIGGLDIPTSGKIIINNLDLGNQISLENYRQNYVGFVFQDYNLLDELNVFDNIGLAVSYVDKDTRINSVNKVLGEVGLNGFNQRLVSELSGGQKQRVAIARALAKNSKVLLCDEPTGNLDSETGREIIKLLKKIAQEKLVIIVSHNEELTNEFADRIIKLKDGIVVSDNYKAEMIKEKIGIDIRESEIKNRVSFTYKIKYGIKNLIIQKFKTSIAFLLLFMSLFSLCIMQLSLSYNSEKSLEKSIDNEKTIIIIKNNFTNNEVSNIFEKFQIKENIDDYLTNTHYSDGYRTQYGTVFIINNYNQQLLQSKNFYFKNDLIENSAYVTDYFVDLVINYNNSFNYLSYENYNELSQQDVLYNGQFLFKISGVIQTDYKDYYDERGNEKGMVDTYDSKLSYENDLNFKLNYQYQTIYTTDDTFETMNTGNYSITFVEEDDYTIYAKEGYYTTLLSSVEIKDIQRNILLFYMDNGFFGSSNMNDTKEDNTQLRPLLDNEIIISGDLYNKIFGESINWEEFNRQYNIALDTGMPMTNVLKHLNKEVSITVENENGNVIEIINKKIIGIDSNYSIGKEETYTVFGLKDSVGLNNKLLSKHYVSEIDWKNISNKINLLKTFRENAILVAGVKATLIYEKEYIMKQMNYFFIGIAIVFSLMALISIFNLVNAKIKDKTKEIGILYAIGLKKSEINFMYMFQIICMMIFSISLTIGLLYLTEHIVNFILIEKPFGLVHYFNINWLTYIVILISSFILFVVSLYPLIKITRRKPVDIIKNK